MSNDHLVLVGGLSASGKSAALMNIKDHPGVLYLNCEAGKKLPFKNDFIKKTITDPLQIFEAFDWAETKPNIHTVVVDTLTYLMDMYESQYVLPLANKMEGWSNFAQYFKTVMQQKVASSSKKVIFNAHTLPVYNETNMSMDVMVPVKGALKNQGIESYFSCVIAAKKMALKDLDAYKNPLLTITADEQLVGYKHVFQTRLTKDTVNERIRGPMGLFSQQETFINNDIQLVLDRLDEFYN
jgi:hypothetical protein